jgi:CheY-like chemotaxis protein
MGSVVERQRTHGMPQAILVVDDEPTLVDSLALFLGDEGFTVLTGRNGAEALAHHDQTRADLIVSDVMMPIVDGHALVAALRFVGEQSGRHAGDGGDRWLFAGQRRSGS